MLLLLRILLWLVAAICLIGGTNIILKGAMDFLPKGMSKQQVLDNLVRFLGGIYLSSGFLVAYVAFNVVRMGDLIYFIGVMVIFSGLGRLYSRSKVGTAGKYFDIIMMVEGLLGAGIIALKWLL
ncbi:MAG: DUF4345 family protein [Ferruginibacter sp.]|nr:DUF4345 family protein [Ferruginibacter sp.]